MVLPMVIHLLILHLLFLLRGYKAGVKLSIWVSPLLPSKALPANYCMKSLLSNHHLQDYRLFHHILQTHHPLYNKDISDQIIERPQLQIYDTSVRHIVKLPIQEYYDVHAC